ncbi:hypothetical protein ACHAWF_001036, partial [Thalassiosira exigua]
GSADFSRLTELGRRQAADAFGALRGDDVAAVASVYSSPLTRARDTLGELRRQDELLLAKVLPPTESVLNDLREIDLYDWQGVAYDDLEAKFPSSWRAWREGNPEEMIVFETRESSDAPLERYPLLELWERADRVWDEIFLQEQQRHQRAGCEGVKGVERTALIVAHGNLGQALLGTAMGWDANYFHVHDFPNCGMAEIDFSYCNKRPKQADRWRWRWPRKEAEWSYAATD